jgi:hypothetical protein
MERHCARKDGQQRKRDSGCRHLAVPFRQSSSSNCRISRAQRIWLMETPADFASADIRLKTGSGRRTVIGVRMSRFSVNALSTAAEPNYNALLKHFREKVTRM